ncbi:anti-anti sigma factor protein [Sorangium cellulosum]|uniref:Anti-anti sigma factor protein n=1 Tax=Sorangium cellulosum TaxID=56 RepID=A0A2L0F1V7_SORCE|nr:STAS domain-containing protein [Sorangium cellulosum]AUX45540.1 anti-anti sigma factor protein [Sorangium cellulosum]
MNDDPEDSAAQQEELAALRRQVADLEQQVAGLRDREATLRERLLEQSALLDELPAIVSLKDREHRFLIANKAFTETFGLSSSQILGKSDLELFPPETAHIYLQNDELTMAAGAPRRNVELLGSRADGTPLWTMESHIPRRDVNGEVIGLLSVLIDITDRKEAEAALQKTEAELRAALARQEQMLATMLAMSAPVLPIHRGILVLPLVGHIDAARSSHIVEALLSAVERHAAGHVIVDLTGVPVVDEAIAAHLVRAASALRLLGARSIFVGISPAIARTLAHLEVDLAGITLLGDLQAGMSHALAQTGHTIRRVAL